MIISPNNYFQEELIKEFSNSSVNDQSIIYLLGLLHRNIKTENFLGNAKKPGYLTLMLKEISEERSFNKASQLTLKLAETSLFVSSFFPELIMKRNTNINFYLSVGTLSYSSLSQNQYNPDLKIAYKNISDNFLRVVEGISGLNKNLENKDSEFLLEAYEETSNSQYLSALIKKGIFPKLNSTF